MTSPRASRDLWVTLGLSISALSALTSSFSGLRSLALLAGWSPLMAPLLPMTIDAYAMTATRVWLADSTTSVHARRFARSNAVGAILLSLFGNATAHLIAARLVAVSWVVVLGVGAVPPVVLGLVSHLAVLRRQRGVVPAAVPGTEPVLTVRTPYAAHAELLAAARSADAAYRTAHGKPITRDALRKALKVSAARATAALQALRAEPP